MNIFVKMTPYLIAQTIAFYLLPLFIKNTGTAIIVLLVLTPLICFVIAILYSIKNTFSWIYPIMIAILFLPTLFIFYNYTAWVYIAGYAILSLVGIFTGNFLKKY